MSVEHITQRLEVPLEPSPAGDDRLTRELDDARDLQMHLMGVPPELEGLEVAAIYQPANELSGDFYALERLEDGTLMGLVADITGHGVAAALLGSRLQAAFQFALADTRQPGALLARINRELLRLNTAHLATALCFRIGPQRRVMTVANAGHLAPILVRDSAAWRFDGCSRTALGVLPDEEYPEEQVCLQPGDLLIMMTDGVAECLSFAGWVPAQEMLTAISQGPSDLVLGLARLFSAVDEADLGDDATLIGVRVE